MSILRSGCVQRKNISALKVYQNKEQNHRGSVGLSLCAIFGRNSGRPIRKTRKIQKIAPENWTRRFTTYSSRSFKHFTNRDSTWRSKYQNRVMQSQPFVRKGWKKQGTTQNPANRQEIILNDSLTMFANNGIIFILQFWKGKDDSFLFPWGKNLFEDLHFLLPRWYLRLKFH